MAAPVKCSAPGCNYEFGVDLDPTALVPLIELHARTAHPQAIAAAPGEPATKAEKVRRPTITTQGTTEDWTYFYSRWQEY